MHLHNLYCLVLMEGTVEDLEVTALLRIPGQFGHPFQFISDSHSNSIRTPVPIYFGH